MKNLLCVCVLFFSLTLFAQKKQFKAEKYPSLLWEISGKGLSKPSFLFGTMHVSSKMAFNLSDSFYLGIKSAQVVALETNPGTWQEDFSRYDLNGEGLRQNLNRRFATLKNEATPQDYLNINSLKLTPFEKEMEAALYSSPSIINSFLYRSNSEVSSDFEEDTYLDLHIFQTAKKLGKKVCGVEDFDGSMQLVKEAYADAAKDKKKGRSFDSDEEFSYDRLEEAYRTGNLDLLDTINKINSQSAAFDEKFLYKRNDIQAAAMDSILKTGVRLFAGVGAAHLPGERGVIEILRRRGYRLRPIRMTQRDRFHKEHLEKLRVPVLFTKQTTEDGFYSVAAPGKLLNFGNATGGAQIKQYTDMVNGSYYMVTRIHTNAAILGHSETEVLRKLDSVMYENIPGKILSKKAIVRNGYRGYDVTNRTRRGDLQRYNLFVSPFEIILFKISGNGDYIKLGNEAEQFFSSIQLKEQKQEWKKWSPLFGGFEVDLPHAPLENKNGNSLYMAYDAAHKTAFEIIRTGIHNYDFLEEDSFDLALMEESFASSDFVSRSFSKNQINVKGYPALDAKYRLKDSTIAVVRFLVQGPNYYTLIASSKEENPLMNQFIRSFSVRPFVYGEAKQWKDTALQFNVFSPVPLEKKSKLQMYPEEAYDSEYEDADERLLDMGQYKSKIIEHDSTGEKIYVALFKPSPYVVQQESARKDSSEFKKEWLVRKSKRDTLSNGLVVYEYELGANQSSRMLKGKMMTRNGIGYKLVAERDTLSKESSFIARFFNSFEPLDLLNEVDVKKKKTTYFFTQFFSQDSLERKKAIRNISSVKMDSSDFGQLRQSITSLSWKEKKYLAVKKEFVSKLAGMKNKEASDFLKDLYYNAGDTLELQYTALETLLGQQTPYSYQLFSQIMQNDPPVLNVERENETFSTNTYKDYNLEAEELFASSFPDGSFFDNLTDSLPLTAGIIRNLLPLININDYEQPMLELLGLLVDSSYLHREDYETYLPKFILEAKQTLKKQVIQEKNKSIESAKNQEEKQQIRQEGNEDPGNSKLSLYATLVLPFQDKHPQVQGFMNQLLSSNDRRLKYNTSMLLLRHNRPVPDTMLTYFSGLNEYRYELYTDLKKLSRSGLITQLFKDQTSMARSQLLSTGGYSKMDTLVYLQKRPFAFKEHRGTIYFFKYKEKKEDMAWKLATAGLFPDDTTRFDFSGLIPSNAEQATLNFTEFLNTKLTLDTSIDEQLDKLLKKLLYSRRKSAANFYNDNERYGEFDISRVRF